MSNLRFLTQSKVQRPVLEVALTQGSLYQLLVHRYRHQVGSFRLQTHIRTKERIHTLTQPLA